MALVLSFLTVFVSPIMVVMSSNIILLWLFLELSSVGFIFLFSFKVMGESLLSYFLIQSLGSMLLLMSYLISWFESYEDFFCIVLLYLSMMVSMGAAPFHFWVLQIGKLVEWYCLFLLLTIQKVAPLFLFMKASLIELLYLIFLMGISFGTLSQFGVFNVKSLLVYSSVVHLSWLMLSGVVSDYICFLYLLFYMMIVFMIINKISLFNFVGVFMQLYYNGFSLFIHLVSLAGMPPFLGFLLKWMVLSISLSTSSFILLLLLFIMSSCLNVYIYMRLVYKSFLILNNFSLFSEECMSLGAFDISFQLFMIFLFILFVSF